MNHNSNKSSTLGAIDGQQSLLTAISRFVQAVDSMDETVMIPCRLRDIAVDTVAITNISDEENNNKALVPATPISGDLYHFYAMLHAIRSEIIAGPKWNEEENSDDSEDNAEESNSSDENARKTAASFRFHLRGLFGLLHQMTETAKYLTSRYESEVSSSENGIVSVSSFNM